MASVKLSERSAAGPSTDYARAVEAVLKRPDAIDLTVTNPLAADLPYDAELLRHALSKPDPASYRPEPFGLPVARAAVAASYWQRGVRVGPERVLLTASTSEAYGFLFKLLCDPGDTVLVPAPSYPLLQPLARHEAVQLDTYRLDYDGAWFVDFDSLNARLHERVRAIVAVSPNNPTGSFLREREVAGLCETGLPLICDEVFADYAYAERPRQSDAAPVPSALAFGDAPVFALGGLSKSCGLPQLKLAWCVAGGPEERIAPALERLEHIADAALSVSTPVQRALSDLLAYGARMRGAIHQRCADNLARLRELCAPSPVSLLHCEGGWSAVLRLPDTDDEDTWLARLHEAGLVVQPGWLYDFEQKPIAVLSLLTPPDRFGAGVARLIEVVRASVE